MKRIYLAVVALLGTVGAAGLLTACGSSGSSADSGTTPPATTASTPASTSGSSTSGALPSAAGSITVGSADFPENELLMDIYGDAMSAKGVKVTKKPNIGERALYLPALEKGDIGFIPEYTGSILATLQSGATQKTPSDVFDALKTAAAANGLVPLQYAAAQDSDTITVTQATAQKYHLKTIADLKSVASQFAFGAPAAFKTRPDGIPALKSVYGVTFGRFIPLRAGGTFTVDALKNGTVQGADIFSTDPSIVKNHFVSLQDPKSMFAAQNIVPLFKQSDLTQPMKDACDAVSAKLDTTTLAQLVTKVEVDGQSADSVAQAWLKSAGITS